MPFQPTTLRRPILTGSAEQMLAEQVHPSFRIYGSPTSEPAGQFVLAHPDVTRAEIAARVDIDPGEAGWIELSWDDFREFVPFEED